MELEVQNVMVRSVSHADRVLRCYLYVKMSSGAVNEPLRKMAQPAMPYSQATRNQRGKLLRAAS